MTGDKDPERPARSALEIELDAQRKALREAQAELEASRARHLEFYDLAPVGYLTLDEQGSILEANLAAASLLGVSRNALVGQPLNRFFHLDDQETYRHHDGLLASAGGEQTFDVRAARGERTAPWVRVIATATQDGEGASLRRVVLTDITDRKEVEEALGESERRYRRLFETSRDALMTLEPPSWAFTSGNPACVEMFRAKDEADFTAHGPSDLSPERQPDGRPSAEKAMEAIQGAIREGHRHFEWVHKRIDGETFFADVLLTRIEAAGREFLQATVRDISARRHAEDELRLQSAALNAAANAIVITDTEGTIRWVNAAFVAASGYGAEEAIGKNPRDLVKSGAHDREFYRQLWETILAGNVWRGEMTNRRKDGSRHPEELTITPVKDERGRITHFVAIKRDLTAERLLQAQFLQAQKMEIVGQLAGGVAHDFNNLLTVINVTADLAAGSLTQEDPLRADLAEILHAGRRAASLTQQLLAFSRKQIVKPEVVDLSELVVNMQGMLQRVLSADIALVVAPTHALPPVRVDPAQIEQVILNLVFNARDAMPNGGTLTIETQEVDLGAAASAMRPPLTPGPHVAVMVRDTGSGMDEATLAHLFEPFFTTKEQGKGTGLGLATVYGIVQKAAGSLSVRSAFGKGTTFTVYLPRLATPPRSIAPTSIRSTRPGAETILLVDDEPALLRVATRILQRAGYALFTAGNGEEALELLQQRTEPIHLVLTDVVMPGIGGPELAARLATIRPEIRILFMSGYTDDVVLRHGVLHDTTNFIGKPFTSGQLTQAIRKALDARVD